MPRGRSALLAGLLLAGTVTAAWAQSGTWRPLGPPGGAALALAVDPASSRLIYAGSIRLGVFRSIDSGVTWERASTGLPTPTFVYGLAADPSQPGRVLAALGADGLWQSLDAGASWQLLYDLPAGESFWWLVFDPSSPTRLYASASGLGMIRSEDGGRTWTPLASVGGLNSWGFAVAAGGTLFAIEYPGILRSRDRGVTWEAVNNGLPADLGLAGIAADPSNAGRLFANESHRLYTSTDDGDHWQLLGKLPSQTPFLRPVVSRRDPAKLFLLGLSEVVVSLDGGVTFSAVAGLPNSYFTGPPRVHALVEPSISGEDMLAATNISGIFRSADGGLTWQESSTGFDAAVTHTVLFDPLGNGAILAGTHGNGLQRTEDGGHTWHRPPGIPFDARVFQLESALTLPAFVYSGTDSGVYRSSDGGASWVSASDGLPPGQVIILAVGATDARRLVALLDAGLWQTVDGGASWVPLFPARGSGSRVTDMVLDPRDPTRLYLSMYEGGASGICVIETSTVPTYCQPVGGLPISVWDLEVDLRKGGRVFAATSGGIYALEAATGQWTLQGVDPGSIAWLALDPSVEQRVFAALARGGAHLVFESPNLGGAWSQLGPPPGLPLLDLAVDPRGSGRVIVATLGEGVLELVPEPLFADGFETGDLSAWSAASP